MDRSHWQDWLVMAIGLVLFVFPFAVATAPAGGGSPAVITAAFVIAGLGALALGAIGVSSDQTWEEWAIFALGAWLVVAPWLVGYSAQPTAMITSIGAGLVLAVLAVISLTTGAADY